MQSKRETPDLILTKDMFELLSSGAMADVILVPTGKCQKMNENLKMAKSSNAISPKSGGGLDNSPIFESKGFIE